MFYSLCHQLDQLLEDRTFLFGARPTAADAVIAGSMR